MSTAKFKVGDKVRIIDTDEYTKADIGMTGTIVEHGDCCYDWLVEFDKPYNFTHSGYDKSEKKYRWYNSEWLELVEEKSKHRFQVGDKVVAKSDAPYGITKNGWKGKVIRIDEGYMVVRGGERVDFHVRTEHFDLDKSVQPWKIVIEGSGDTTTAKYIEGRTVVKTETVKRYHTDEYSVAKAVEAVTKKLLSEGEKANEPESKCKVGDLVECIDSSFDVCGKRGYLVKRSCGTEWLVDFKVEYIDTHTGNCLPGDTGLWLYEDIGFKKVK